MYEGQTGENLMSENRMTVAIPAVQIPSNAGERYRRDGFYLTPPIIPADLIERVSASMDTVMAGEYETGEPPRRSWNPGDDPKRIRKIDQAHLSNRTIYELASHPEIGRWAAALLGAKRVQLWASQMLYKPPGGEVTGNVGWHQDKQYWRYMDGELFTAWVAVSDVTEQSGPMRFLRGSHRWGLLDSGDFFGHDHEAQQKDIPVPEGESWEEVAAASPSTSGPKTPGRWRGAQTTTCSTWRIRPIARCCSRGETSSGMSALLVVAGIYLFLSGVLVWAGGRTVERIGLTTRNRGLIALILGTGLLIYAIAY